MEYQIPFSIVGGKVDLGNPVRVLRIDIVGGCTGISVLGKSEVFSLAKLQSN